jgi:hypothetical protein
MINIDELKVKDAMKWKRIWGEKMGKRISRQLSATQSMIDQKQPENVGYVNFLGSTITNGARYTHEIKYRIVMAKAAFNKKKTFLTRKFDLNLSKKLVKCYIWSVALCGAETWTLRKVDQKFLESFEMLCWRRMEKISWTDRVRNKEVGEGGEEYPTYNKKKKG